MAIVVTREKERSDRGTADVPYFVHDPSLSAGTEMNRLAAIEAAAAQGLIDQGTEANGYEFERQSHNSGLVRLTYDEETLTPFPQPNPPLTPPATGSVSFGFNALPAEPVHHDFSIATKWKLPRRPEYGAAPDFQCMVDVQEWAGGTGVKYRGYTKQVPAETDSVEYVIPNALFTAAYRNIVQSLLYKVHQGEATFFGRPSGSVMLVRAQARQRSNEDLMLSFGFSCKANGPRDVAGISTESIGAPPVDGHDYVWTVWFWQLITAGAGMNIETPYPRWIYCEQIWERGDLNQLALPGSTDPVEI